jgi:hypothetical protein
MRFPALEVFSLPPASIHGYHHGANPQRFVLQDFECLRRGNGNVNFLASRLWCEKGVVNRFPLIRGEQRVRCYA